MKNKPKSKNNHILGKIVAVTILTCAAIAGTTTIINNYLYPDDETPIQDNLEILTQEEKDAKSEILNVMNEKFLPKEDAKNIKVDIDKETNEVSAYLTFSNAFSVFKFTPNEKVEDLQDVSEYLNKNELESMSIRSYTCIDQSIFIDKILNNFEYVNNSQIAQYKNDGYKISVVESFERLDHMLNSSKMKMCYGAVLKISNENETKFFLVEWSNEITHSESLDLYDKFEENIEAGKYRFEEEITQLGELFAKAYNTEQAGLSSKYDYRY